MKALNVKAQSHERFLSLRQRVEDLKENTEVQVPKTKDESIDKEERYITCQALLTQILFIKPLCKEASDELENFSVDLYPSQLTAEQKRLRQNLDSLNTWEMAIQNNLQIVEWEILKDVHYPSEQRAVQDFLKETNRVLEKPCRVEPKQSAIDQEFRKCLNLRKSIEARMQILEVLENKKRVGHKRKSQKSKHLADLAKMALDNCDQRMIIFRKISDVKKEEEERQRAKNEVPLTIPVDHPVRKLFQKFKQQKELRNQEASVQHDLEKNQQHLHTHLQHTQLQQPHTAITQNTLHAVQNGAASTGCCSGVVTISQITPIQNSLSFSKPGDPIKQNNRDIMDLKPSGDQTPSTTRLKVSNAARAKPAGTARGWMRLKNNMAPPGSPPEDGGKEGRNNVMKAVSMERLSPEVKVQIEGVIEVSGSRKNSLRKMDSWDSGLTHSDQRLDHMGEVQSPVSGGEGLGQELSFQAALQEARVELRGEIQALSGRMAVLEEQVGQILRLLSGKSDPPVRTSTPRTYRDKLKAQDIFTVSTPGSPDSDKEDGSV
ncbi:hypothetical protein AOLI_G00015130 [Acnodon oligacanthus]